MDIQLHGWTTESYLGLLDDILHTCGQNLPERYLMHQFKGTPVIDYNGSFTESYIDSQDEDGKIFLGTINKYFDEKHELYHFGELIVDRRQLGAANTDDVGLTKPCDVLNKLIRSPEVRDVVMHYIGQENGYFAAMKDRKKGAFVAVTPPGTRITGSLEESEKRLHTALSNLQAYRKSRGSENRFSRALHGAFGVYVIELLTHPEWKEAGKEYIGEIIYHFAEADASAIVDIAGELARKGAFEYLPSTDGLLAVLGAVALAYGPDLLDREFWKKLSDKKKSNNTSRNNILEILENR